jgi:hypothetical protein
MSAPSNDAKSLGPRPIPAEQQPGRADLPVVDCSGLGRVIELLAAGGIDGEAGLGLLRQERASVQQQASAANELLEKALVELRQLRESQEREQLQKRDEQRQLQDGNDQFVANLLHEHEVEMAALRRERDAAFERIRDLSRGITRVGTNSIPSMARVSDSNALNPASSSGSTESTELKARVEELLLERERSLRLLRQLAEQRDRAESRLRAALNGASSGAPAPAVPAAEPQNSAARAANKPRLGEDPGSERVVPTSIPDALLKKASDFEGRGAYSMHAEELHEEEVFLLRTPKNAPQGS